MRQGLFPICIICAVTVAASWKIFDESSIAVVIGIDNSDWHNRFCKQCFVVPFWYNETLLQAMSLYIQRPLPCKSLLGAAQTRCSASCRCRLRFFSKRSFSTPQECAAITGRDVHRDWDCIPTTKKAREFVSRAFSFAWWSNLTCTVPCSSASESHHAAYAAFILPGLWKGRHFSCFHHPANRWWSTTGYYSSLRF